MKTLHDSEGETMARVPIYEVTLSDLTALCNVAKDALAETLAENPGLTLDDFVVVVHRKGMLGRVASAIFPPDVKQAITVFRVLAAVK
jgi:hypothetical protein